MYDPLAVWVCGKNSPAGDGQLRPRLEDAERRLPQREVLLAGHGDEPIQRRIVEDAPPMRQVRRLAAKLGVGDVDPMGGHGGGSGVIVGANLEAVADIFQRARTAADHGNHAGDHDQRRPANAGNLKHAALLRGAGKGNALPFLRSVRRDSQTLRQQ